MGRLDDFCMEGAAYRIASDIYLHARQASLRKLWPNPMDAESWVESPVRPSLAAKLSVARRDASNLAPRSANVFYG